MMMKSTSPWFVLLAVLGLGGAASPVWANPPLDPLAAASMTEALQVDPHSSEHLNHLAESIHYQMNAASEADADNTLDFRQLPLVGEMVDEQGNLNLPMGLMLYNTMGDTSIGFGSKF